MNSTSCTTEMATVHLVDGVFLSETHIINPSVELFRAHLQQLRSHFGDAIFPVPSVVKSPKTSGSSSKELRDFMSTEEFSQSVACLAIITDSVLTRAAANLFLRISRPNCPTQLFTDEAKAFEWAKQYARK